jgi:hypothetical protein
MSMVSTLPRPEDILAMDREQAAETVRALLRQGEMSRLVKQLNADILNGAAEAREMAQRCLEHMGFVV